MSFIKTPVKGMRDCLPADMLLRQKVMGLVLALPKKERMVVEMRYGLLDGAAHPQHEVATVLGISRSYVSRMEKRALAMLREGLEKRE